jgi:putative endonuclease
VSWTVYILRCGDGTLYTGITTDLDRRIAEHGAGRGGAYTRSRRPLQVLFAQPRPDRGSALRFEAKIKRLTRREKLALVRDAPQA